MDMALVVNPAQRSASATARRRSSACGALFVLLLVCCTFMIHAQNFPYVGAMRIEDVAPHFAQPPDDARIMMRWWWFGPAVIKPELQREILAMKAAGIGGFEIQPVYPQAVDDASTGFRNLPYLSTDFLDALSFVNETAHENGMRVDLTLASGWPYGGPSVPIDQAAGRLRVVAVDVPQNVGSIAVPSLENGEALLAVFIGEGTAESYAASSLHPISFQAQHGRLSVPPAPTARVVVFYIASRTGQQVKRAAVGANGFVVDHYSHAAVASYLQHVGSRLLTAFGSQPPFAVFSDSLEVFATDWTTNFLAEFERRRGYSLLPYLPELVNGQGEQAAELRHDWGLTLTELANENYLTQVNDWAKQHGALFRSQNYGYPPVSLSSNRLVALPEGEGSLWNRFSFARWATSAGHLYGRPVISGEVWTWLHSPAFRATPLDMKAEADRFFLEGVNQIVGHGWPYSPPGIPEPGWQFYAAGALNDHNPWWIVMPDVTAYLQRLSYLLRQGKPANDIAVLLPEDDAYAEFTPGRASLSDLMPQFVTPELTQQIEAAGHNFDYVDAEAIARVGVHYPVLVLPHVQRLAPGTLSALIQYVQHGGKVIAVGSTPSKAPGFQNAAATTAQVEELARRLFALPGTQTIDNDGALGAALGRVIAPDVQVSSDAGEIGLLHRKLSNADIYFLVNTSNHPVHATARLRNPRAAISSWSPFSGKIHSLPSGDVALDLSPYESRVIVASDHPLGTPQAAFGKATVLATLDRGWSIDFAGTKGGAQAMEGLSSWSDLPARRFFSGVATYRTKVQVQASALSPGHVLLDFGHSAPADVDPDVRNGTRAMLAAPVRDAAVVLVNGKRAGSLWCPPYRMDITAELHAGENEIEVQVANTAINLLAGMAPADFHLVWMRYGRRAVNQDTQDLHPLPSGLLGPIQLLEVKSAR